MTYELHFLYSLGITLLVEVPLVVVLMYLFKEAKIGIWRTIGIGILATSLTIPYLWFIFNSFFDYRKMVIGGELFVFLVEMLIYRKLLPIKFSKAVVISLVANLASILVGLVLTRL
jgi:hypothetical protein